MRSLTPALAVSLLLASCGEDTARIPQATPYADPGFVTAGGHRLHYALILTRDLPSEIAGSYGIERRRNLALLSITIASQATDSGTRIEAAELAATAVQLTGVRQVLTLVRHDDRGGPTYLATLEVRHRVPVTIEIRARALAASPELAVRTTREFHLD